MEARIVGRGWHVDLRWMRLVEVGALQGHGGQVMGGLWRTAHMHGVRWHVRGGGAWVITLKVACQAGGSAA
jgi:hypothetical protein